MLDMKAGLIDKQRAGSPLKTAGPHRLHRAYTRTVRLMQARFELAFPPVQRKSCLEDRHPAELTPAKALSSQRAGQHGKKGRKTSATFPRDERDWFRLPMPHRAKDNCDSTNGANLRPRQSITVKSGNYIGGATRSGRTSICIAVQRCLTGEGLIPWA